MIAVLFGFALEVSFDNCVVAGFGLFDENSFWTCFVTVVFRFTILCSDELNLFMIVMRLPCLLWLFGFDFVRHVFVDRYLFVLYRASVSIF